jgi:hypothetical protein
MTVYGIIFWSLPCSIPCLLYHINLHIKYSIKSSNKGQFSWIGTCLGPHFILFQSTMHGLKLQSWVSEILRFLSPSKLIHIITNITDITIITCLSIWIVVYLSITFPIAIKRVEHGKNVPKPAFSVNIWTHDWINGCVYFRMWEIACIKPGPRFMELWEIRTCSPGSAWRILVSRYPRNPNLC